MSEQVLLSETRAGTVTYEPGMPEWDCALKSLDNFVLPAKASRGRFDATPGEMHKKTQPDTLAGKRLQFNKEDPLASTKDEYVPLVTDGSQNVRALSVKRTISDVERSPEPLEIQAKKSDAEYKRCFEIPDKSVGLHSGLTGVFTVQLEDFRPSTEGSRLAVGDQVPRPSSPSAVTKNLLCELEEPTEDVFIDDVRDLANGSFASGEDYELTRSLSFDSEGSMHEMSIVVNSPAASQKPSRCSKMNSTSTEEMKENKNVTTPGSLPHTPTAANIKTPKLGNAFHRGESMSSVFGRLSDMACSVTKSPSFLKPRNVVAFRSYCSAIDRSNVSWNSHLSLGSVEAMDMSPSASYHSLSAAITPVQKTPASNGSLYQVEVNSGGNFYTE